MFKMVARAERPHVVRYRRAVISVRPLSPTDAPAVLRLTHQLGYDIASEDQKALLADIAPDGVFVAVDGEEVIGWVHAFRCVMLQTEPFAEIAGLVVDEDRRGTGVGRALVHRIESWAAEQGLREIRVRSNVVREGAHRFYPQLGYSVVKTSTTFLKTLSP